LPRKKKKDFNPSSRDNPEDKPTAYKGESTTKKAYYAKNSLSDYTLRKLAEEARDALREKLHWRERKYREMMKWILLMGIFLGCIIGVIIGGTIL